MTVIAHTLDDLAPHRGGVLVPTMGALHSGHVDLVRHAASEAAARGAQVPVVVSVFVNPTQFDESHDFERYPRTLERDAALCFDAGATCVFAPAVEVMYPEDGSVRVPRLPEIARLPGLEDRYRPGHFEGVCQVCKRLFEVTGAAAAVFGEKDWQQLQTVRAMSAQEGLGTEIVGHETVREPDGLAMSSRNVHLSAEERARAAAVSRGLMEAGRYMDPEAAEAAGRGVLESAGMSVDYFAVRDAETLLAVRPGEPGRVLAAARLGPTRLIDNAAWPGFRV